jgi:arylsulfatase A-like enzyme
VPVFTVLSLLPGGACWGPDATATDTRPNIVFILLDDVRADDFQRPFIDPPNIDRVAAEGAVFTDFFTTAPLCSPSRAGFLAGQYPHVNGIIDNGERNETSHRLVTWRRLLHDSGYRTAFFGKWHMGHEDDSPRPGFDRGVRFLGQGDYFDPEMNVDGEILQEAGYITDILTRQAVEFIQEAPDSQPFVVFLAHKAVHPEVHPNRVRTFPPATGDEDLYAGASIARAPSVGPLADGKHALGRGMDFHDPRSPPGGTPDEVILNRLRMLSAVDRGVGEVLAALEDRGKLDRTVVVITSDQGFFYGEHGLAQERRLAYDPSIRIPLLLRYPTLARPGTSIEALAINLDVAPTMLELGHAPALVRTEGRSLVPTLAGDTVPHWRQAFLIEYYSDSVFARIRNMGYKALRTDRYKYIRYTELVGVDELYDLAQDPEEIHNLLANGAPFAPVSELDAQLDRILATGATSSP